MILLDFLFLRSLDRPDVHPEPLPPPGVAQGQVPPPHRPVHPPFQAPPPSTCHRGVSAAPRQAPFDRAEPDREHPLTRLEIALAEVQRCDGPLGAASNDGCQGNAVFADTSPGPAHSLSVLEKVSRFEHRERAVKQRSTKQVPKWAWLKGHPIRVAGSGCGWWWAGL